MIYIRNRVIDLCVAVWNWDRQLGTKNGEQINDMIMMMIAVMDGSLSMGGRVRKGRTRQLFNQFDAMNLKFLDY